MKSRALFFNPTLLKKNFFRYSVLWAIFTGCLFLCTSLPLLNTIKAADVFDVWVVCSVPITAIYALICAACCFSYLNKTRSIYMMSAFPITRTKLYFTTLLQGLLFGVLPELVVTLFNLLIANNAVMAEYIWQLLFVGVLEYLFFYGMAVVCMVLTGKTAYGVFCYIVLSFGPYATEQAICTFLKPMLYGVVTFEESITSLLCPLIGIYEHSLLTNRIVIDNSYASGVLGWYLYAVGAAGIVLMALGWLLYRKRRMENAGEAIAFRWLRPICKYAFALFVSFVLGRVIMYFSSLGGGSDVDFGLLLGSLLIAGFVGYFCAEMMLKRSIRVFKGKAFWGYAVFALLLSAVVISAKTDLFGIVHRIPQKQEVSSFELTSEDGVVLHYDAPGDVEEIIGVHELILDTPYVPEDSIERHWLHFRRNVTITYHLTDGSSFSRTYQSASRDLKLLVQQTKATKQYFDGFDLENQSGGKVVFMYDDGYKCYLNAEQIKQIAQYLEEDMAKITFPSFYAEGYVGYSSFYIELSDGRTVSIPSTATKAYDYLRNVMIITEG